MSLRVEAGRSELRPQTEKEPPCPQFLYICPCPSTGSPPGQTKDLTTPRRRRAQPAQVVLHRRRRGVPGRPAGVNGQLDGDGGGRLRPRDLRAGGWLGAATTTTACRLRSGRWLAMCPTSDGDAQASL